MRVLSEQTHEDIKITIFQWNNRYLIKLEQGLLEQTYKIDQFDVAESQLRNVVDESFLQQVRVRFTEMYKSLHEAIQRAENQPNWDAMEVFVLFCSPNGSSREEK